MVFNTTNLDILNNIVTDGYAYNNDFYKININNYLIFSPNFLDDFIGMMNDDLCLISYFKDVPSCSTILDNAASLVISFI